jgi:hypothetical protein
MPDEIIKVPKEYILKLIYKLMEIEVLSNDIKQKHDINLLVDFIQKFILGDECENLKLEDLIYDKMIEAKGTNDELNAKLYILYQDLSNNRISRNKALDLLTMYLHMDGIE